MPDPVDLPRLDHPLAGLRSAVQAQRATVEAAKQIGQQLQAERTAPPAPTQEGTQ